MAKNNVYEMFPGDCEPKVEKTPFAGRVLKSRATGQRGESLGDCLCGYGQQIVIHVYARQASSACTCCGLQACVPVGAAKPGAKGGRGDMSKADWKLVQQIMRDQGVL